MKNFNLVSNNLDSAASLVCIKQLSKLLQGNSYRVAINDTNFSDYDVLIFMSDVSEKRIKKIRNKYKDARIGVADPKPLQFSMVSRADFVLVSSIEQRELFIKYNQNIFVYYMFPLFDYYPVNKSTKNSVIRLLYHGNKIHLNAFYKDISPALNKLGEVYNIELHAVYNIQQLGRWEIGRPDESKCRVIDLQWYENCYQDYFNNIDIGLVPNLMPIKNTFLSRFFLSISKVFFLEAENDHLLRLKTSNNPGRLFVYAMFHVPVVTDATPSTCEIVRDGYNGRVVMTKEGWYAALKELIDSAEKRKVYGNRLNQTVVDHYNPKLTFDRFIEFLELPSLELVEVKVKRVNFKKYLFYKLVKRVSKHFNI